MTRIALLLLGLSLAACQADSGGQQNTESRPNVLLIVADDMGYADIGSFGGEIATPNLDRLAHDGLRFTHFIAASMCSPSRAMMLTGVDSHRTGFGNMLEELSPNQKGQPGYEGYLVDSVVTLPALLRNAGYQTFMTGKWHLGSGEGRDAASRGFDRSFTLDSGGASHFADMRPAYAPSPDVKASYWADGRKLDRLPEDFHYSSEFYVDRLIGYLEDDRQPGTPFFAYLSFTAPHWPLQAPDTAIEAQKGRYDEGYDVLAEARLARQKQLGVVASHATRGQRSPKEVPFDSLDAATRETEIRAMEIYAAMVAELDRHTGRLIDYLDDQGELDNTIVLFLSDNGPEGHDLDETWPAEAFPDIRRTIDSTHDFSFEAMGREGSYVLYGPNWANAGSPAFSLYKGFPTEGGTRVPAFVYYPDIVKRPALVDNVVYISDIAPTILDLVGVEQPGTQFDGRTVEAMTGMSFAPLLTGNVRRDKDRAIGMELLGKRAVRMGRWKLVHMPSPWGTDDWQLFDLLLDPSETRDIAADKPELVAALKYEWSVYAEANNVIIPDWVSGY
jgi:arylsulfatase